MKRVRLLIATIGAFLVFGLILASYETSSLESRVIGIAQAADLKDEIVYFNTNSLKFHKMSCTWAKRCTKNCIPITREEANKRGGVPCKVCGG